MANKSNYFPRRSSHFKNYKVILSGRGSPLLKAEDEVLKKKLLKYKRERKNTTYKKCEKIRKEKFARLEEIIRSNYKITNEELMIKLGVSKATFYIVYANKARELKRIYKSQSLF